MREYGESDFVILWSGHGVFGGDAQEGSKDGLRGEYGICNI
jgi:hypothetical protein